MTLFDGLDEPAHAELTAHLRPRRLAAGMVLCRAGDSSDSLFVVDRGLLDVLDADSGAVLGRQRPGDVVGEVALLTGEPRSATLVARVPSAVSELSRESFLAVVERHPAILANLAGIVSRKLVARTGPPPAEITALVVPAEGWAGAATAIATARAASAAPLTVLDATDHDIDLAARLDVASTNAPVLVAVAADHDALAEVLERCDRIERVDPSMDPARLGRRLAHASIGIAFGAGGAKAWAHAGVLRSLLRAGYVVDAVTGSNTGAWVGAWTAAGRDAGGVEEILRDAFDETATQAMFGRGGEDGAAMMARLAHETTADAEFADLAVPLTVLTADLAAQRPVLLTEGLVADALIAATTMPGLYPPVRRDEQRLVDAMVLAPVPTAALSGVDITVAVNVLGRQALSAWPGMPEPERAPRNADPVFESLELASLGAAETQTATATIPVTPRFGPATWRDFWLAEQFLAAGEEAMEDALPALAALARPTRGSPES
jgi:NTE family protein